MRSLPPDLAARARLLDRAPSDIVGGNRPRLADGDEMLLLDELFRGRFTEPRLVDRISRMTEAAEAGTGYDADDHRRLALTERPKGLPAAELDDGPAGAPAGAPGDLSGQGARRPGAAGGSAGGALRWAGSTEPGQPHYYRLQGPRFLAEWDNTQRGANHAHSVWRDPERDFGLDVLARHRAAHHPG